jgi:tight adherence protein C
MYSLYLPLALVGTFGAVFFVGMGIEAVMASRRRALDVLRSHVQEISTDLREMELSQPFLERIFIPLVTNLGRLARRITPMGMRDRIARQLVLSGSPKGLDAEKIAAAKIFGALGGGVMGFALARLAGLSGVLSFGATVFMAFFIYLLPGAGLGQRAIGRQEAIRRALPDTMDLLTISVEAGMGFDAALAHVRRNVPGPFSDEIGRLLQEMQIGATRKDAFRHLADRTDVDELRAFVLAMIQADVFGISVSKVLRSQAKDLRIKRRQRAEEKAMKVPVKLIFPLIFCILPAMLVVLLGPGMIRILDALFGVRF